MIINAIAVRVFIYKNAFFKATNGYGRPIGTIRHGFGSPEAKILATEWVLMKAFILVLC